MSEYDSSSEGSESDDGNQQYFRVFQHDFYLSGSLANIEQWKANMSECVQKQGEQEVGTKTNKQIDVFKYLQKQLVIFSRQQNYLLAAYHLRYFSFANYLKQGFEEIVKRYHSVFQSDDQSIIVRKLQQIDQLTTKLTIYLEKLELSRAESYVSEFDSDLMTSVYSLLEEIFPFVTDKYCIWRIVMFLEIMNQQASSYIMNTPFNMSLQYYKKTFKALKSKHSHLTQISLQISHMLDKQTYMEAYIKAVNSILIYNKKPKQQSQKLEISLMCEFITCIKYMNFAAKDKTVQQQKSQQDIFNEYINASLKVPYYRKNDNMPTQYYEKLFLRILNQVKTQPKLTDLALYIDPNVAGQRSKQNFGKLERIVLNLCKQLTQAQQAFISLEKQPEQQYLKKLLQDEQFTLLIQFLQTIMQFNKSAFLKADTEIYQTFLDMAEYLKSAFLSFGKDLWLFPQNIFTPLTLGFFKKISEDINDDLKNILYQMVENLNADKLPQKLVCANGQLRMQKVTRMQYLSAIMYYIEDCSREEEYLNLPEIAPANLETSILLIKSLHVKLKHHEPNPAQLPLFTQYLKQCEKYKLNINFRWFKQQNYLQKSFQRETQFQIESGIPIKEIQKHIRKCLNYRDREFARRLIEEDYNEKHLINAIEVAALLKYNHGLEGLSEIQNISETEMFALLQQMQTMLAILPDKGLFDLPLQQEVIVNYLHLLLTFYCSKIKSAQGSQIYLMILQKILLNYLKSPFSHSQQFKKKYPKFFERFIYQFHQIEICNTLNELLMNFQQKYESLSREEQNWTWQEKVAVMDLKQKIQIIREEFLDKLQGSQDDIAMWIVTFASLISEQMPFKIFLECLRLFVKLINKKPSLGQFTSVSVFLSQQTYQQAGFFKKILEYVEDYDTENTIQKKFVKCYIVKHITKSPQILQYISFNELMELFNQKIKLFNDIQSIQLDKDVNELFKSMRQVFYDQPEKTKPQWILPFIILFCLNQFHQENNGMFDEQPEKRKQETSQKYASLIKGLQKISQINKQFWPQVKQHLKDFKFKNFQFMNPLTQELKNTFKTSKKQQQNQKFTTFKDLWVYFLTQLNDPSWTFYYIVKINDTSLINIHKNRDEMLINLIKRQKLTKQSYPIFKSIINETKNMQEILDKIMQSYENEQNYVQNYQFHNKLILINERFPNNKIEECILRWISVGENKLPLKIPQNYYINFLKKKLKSLPESVGYDSMLKVNKTPEQLVKLNREVERIFELLLYFPFHKFKSFQLSKRNQQKQKQKQEEKKDQKTTDVMQEKEQTKQQQANNNNNEDDIEQQQVVDDGDEGDWQQQDEDNDDLEIKKTSQLPKSDKNIKKELEGNNNNNNNNNNKNGYEQQQEEMQVNNKNEQNQQQNQEEDNSQNSEQSLSDDGDMPEQQRPQILQMFYEQSGKDKLRGYKRYCELRQQLDVYLKSDYDKLVNAPVADNQFLLGKLMAIIKQLIGMSGAVQESILTYMPQQLYTAISKLGYDKQKDTEKIAQLRKPQKKIFSFQSEFFSDRGQSDGSDEDDENGAELEQSYEEEYYDDDNGDVGMGDSSDDSDNDGDNQPQIEIAYQYTYEGNDNNVKNNINDNNDSNNQPEVIIVKKNNKHYNPNNNKNSNQSQQEEQQIELPELSSQFSKVEAEIKGSELQRKQLIKILQVFLVQLFKLTPINFNKKQVVFSYIEIMESDLGQIFFQSVLTVLRMDQNTMRNRKLKLEEMKQMVVKNGLTYRLQQLTGFQELSKYNGLVNFIHLLKVLKDKGSYVDDQSNPFKKQSGTLLPIAEKFIIEFDLPIQTNVFSLVLLYVHSKSKIKDMIQDIAVSYDQAGVKLTKKQIKRICLAFFTEKAHNSAWEFIQSTVNYEVNDIDRLIISLDTYSQQVFKSLASSALRVKQAIQNSNESYSSAKILSQKQMKQTNLTHIKHYQRLYYITSNLLTSCSQEIKQFYYMNKQVCRYLWEDDEQNEDTYNYDKVPVKLLKAKSEIYTNQSFVSLLELAFRVIYFVKRQLYGKISPKKFARIIHYPKMLIETATLYMHLTGEKGKKTDWKFMPKKDVENIIETTQMGGYKFQSLIQVYNLILGLLEIQSFSAGKFKQLLIPYFTENKQIGLQVPLMFKVPEIDDNNVNGQNIFVTRECSFDMAFYQVNGQGLFVEFHGEQGSDHGGMIRELMMGWKGVGIGEQDFFIGKILGISFRQSVPYGGFIDLQMCIKITNSTITMQNLQQIDKQIYSSLKYVLQNDPSTLGLTFSVTKKNPKNFQVEEFQLIENGRNVEVVEANKLEYIRLYLKRYYEIGRQFELSEIATGFYTVVPQSYAAIFKPHQLMQHIKGQQICDINILKSHVKYMEGYTETSVIIKWLWEILENYNQQQLNKFIQFLTGSPKLPIFNPNFQITIERVFDVKNLPVAHTCFNTLDLPEYPTKDILQKNLLTAIFEGNDNFGIM